MYNKRQQTAEGGRQKIRQTHFMCIMTRNVLFVVCLVVVVILLWQDHAVSQVKLKTNVPELCFKCHKELKKGLMDSYVHFLFKQGKCITCHNSHASKVKGLMIEEIDYICLRCHEEIRNLIRETTIHSALRENECTECHYAHSGENKHLIVEKEKNLCLKCHEDINVQFGESYTCLPFKEGKCSSCHNSHASSEDDLLLSAPNKLCKECHGPRCKVNKVSIVSVVDNSDCTSCHTGHSSMEKGLLGPYGHSAFLEKKCEECHDPISTRGEITTKLENEALCFNCHKRNMSKYAYVDNDVHVKNAKNTCTFCHDYHASNRKNLTMKESRLCAECHEATEIRTAAMERALTSVKCAPVRERKCFECHIPTHSDRPLNYRADEIPMCARCHASQHKITHPLGNDVMDIRNGRPVTCNSCHSMHSANADFMLTHDRKRALCIQCHKM
jgi:predicted CXXCH cytochrome family protein